jgi:hypothetical protein
MVLANRWLSLRFADGVGKPRKKKFAMKRWLSLQFADGVGKPKKEE